MKREPLSLFTFLTQLRTIKVEPIEAEIIDPEGPTVSVAWTRRGANA